MKLRSVRGTHDIFGEEIDKFNFISNIVSKNANLKEYKEIQTPIFEFSDLFAKPLGEHSDVVLKEMYSCLLYTSPSPRDRTRSRMPSSA